MDDDTAVVGQGDPVAVTPDSLVRIEVGVPVTRSVGVVPEVQRHRRHRLGDDQFADGAPDCLAVLVVGVERDTEKGHRQFPSPDRSGSHSPANADTTSVPPEMEKTGACAPMFSDNQIDDDAGIADPVMPTARSADRSWSAPGCVPALMHAST